MRVNRVKKISWLRIPSKSIGLKFILSELEVFRSIPESSGNLIENAVLKLGWIFDSFSSNKMQNVFRIGSEWFVLARKQIPEWLRISLVRQCSFIIHMEIFLLKISDWFGNSLRNSSDSLGNNPNEILNHVWCKSVKIKSDSFWFNPNECEVGLIQNEFSIRIILNSTSFGFKSRIEPNWFLSYLHRTRVESEPRLMPRIKADWFLTVIHEARCKTFFGLLQNDSEPVSINTSSDWFLTTFHQTRYKIIFGLVRNDS